MKPTVVFLTPKLNNKIFSLSKEYITKPKTKQLHKKC